MLVSVERLAAGRARRGQRQKAPNAPAANLLEAVEAAGGSVERIERLGPAEVPGWILARARLHGVKLDADAVATLASAVSSDTERIEQELAANPVLERRDSDFDTPDLTAVAGMPKEAVSPPEPRPNWSWCRSL